MAQSPQPFLRATLPKGSARRDSCAAGLAGNEGAARASFAASVFLCSLFNSRESMIVLFPFQVLFFASSKLLKCRLFEWLLDHPMINCCSLPGSPMADIYMYMYTYAYTNTYTSTYTALYLYL